MRLLKILLLLCFLHAFPAELTAQQVTDSVKVCGLPVKEGIIYRYDRRWYGLCGGQRHDITSIFTYFDLVFHADSDEVVAKMKYDTANYLIIIRNEPGYYFSYSNLRSTSLKKGDVVKKGGYVGLAGKGEAGDRWQVDFMLFNRRNNGANKLSFDREAVYLKCGAACETGDSYTL